MSKRLTLSNSEIKTIIRLIELALGDEQAVSSKALVAIGHQRLWEIKTRLTK